MRDAIGLKPNPQQHQDTSVAAIALETATAMEVVKVLYEEQMAVLNTRATVKQYISVIATKLVKQQLRASSYQ